MTVAAGPVLAPAREPSLIASLRRETQLLIRRRTGVLALVTLLLVPAVYSLVHDGFRGGARPAHDNADHEGSASSAVSAAG